MTGQGKEASGKVADLTPAQQESGGNDDAEQKTGTPWEEDEQTPSTNNTLQAKDERREGAPPKPVPDRKATAGNPEKEDLTPYLNKIALCHKTPFQKRVLTALCQVPRGQYTTYAVISKYLSSSPRAVGNALKNNPFAPHVPCHRVLASGGGIGGFHGSWGRNGKEGLNDNKKRKLLRDEGVKFDGTGKVVGRAWEGFRKD